MSRMNVGVHESGVGGAVGTNGNTVVPPQGRPGMSIMYGRGLEDGYPPSRCAVEFASGKMGSVHEVYARIVDTVLAMDLRSVH